LLTRELSSRVPNEEVARARSTQSNDFLVARFLFNRNKSDNSASLFVMREVARDKRGLSGWGQWCVHSHFNVSSSIMPHASSVLPEVANGENVPLPLEQAVFVSDIPGA
jgi:hypothetical protein